MRRTLMFAILAVLAVPGVALAQAAAAGATDWVKPAAALAAGLGFGLAATGLLFLPFLDRGAAEGRSSRLVTIAGVIALAYLLVFTIYGYLAA